MQRSRQLRATPLNAGVYDPPNGGWIKLDWEERYWASVKSVKRTIHVTRPRALQAMAALEARKTVV